jgi:ATP-dependent Zn protease
LEGYLLELGMLFSMHLIYLCRDDLEKVTKMAYSQVTRFGMNPTIGNVAYPEPKDGDFVLDKPFSEVTGRLIDTEVRKVVFAAYHRTEQLLKEKREGLERVAKLLLEKEVLQREDLSAMLGARPFEEKTSFADLSNSPEVK